MPLFEHRQRQKPPSSEGPVIHLQTLPARTRGKARPDRSERHYRQIQLGKSPGRSRKKPETGNQERVEVVNFNTFKLRKSLQLKEKYLL